MSEEKRYGDAVFGNTLADLKALTPLTQTIDGLRFEGPAQKVGAVLTLAAVAGDLIAEIERLNGTIEDLELALQDAEERAESAGRNASAFEDRMGDLQVENGKLRDRADDLWARLAVAKDYGPKVLRCDCGTYHADGYVCPGCRTDTI